MIPASALLSACTPKLNAFHRGTVKTKFINKTKNKQIKLNESVGVWRPGQKEQKNGKIWTNHTVGLRIQILPPPPPPPCLPKPSAIWGQRERQRVIMRITHTWEEKEWGKGGREKTKGGSPSQRHPADKQINHETNRWTEVKTLPPRRRQQVIQGGTTNWP